MASSSSSYELKKGKDSTTRKTQNRPKSKDFSFEHPRVTLFSVTEFVVFLRVVPPRVSQAFVDIYRLQNTRVGEEVGETGEKIEVHDHQWIKEVTDSAQTMVVVVFDEETGCFPQGMCVLQARRSPISGIFINMFALSEDAGPRVPTPQDRTLQESETVAGLLFHSVCRACPEIYVALRKIFQDDVQCQKAEVDQNPSGATAKAEKDNYNRKQRRALEKFRVDPRFVRPRLVVPLWKNSPLMDDWFAFRKTLRGKMHVMSRRDWEEEINEEENICFAENHSLFTIPFRCSE